jgi:hypothetical protein
MEAYHGATEEAQTGVMEAYHGAKKRLIWNCAPCPRAVEVRSEVTDA